MSGHCLLLRDFCSKIKHGIILKREMKVVIRVCVIRLCRPVSQSLKNKLSKNKKIAELYSSKSEIYELFSLHCLDGINYSYSKRKGIINSGQT